jgi:hypothetical protein
MAHISCYELLGQIKQDFLIYDDLKWKYLIGDERSSLLKNLSELNHLQSHKNQTVFAQHFIMGAEQKESLDFMISDLEKLLRLAKLSQLEGNLKVYNAPSIIKRLFRSKNAKEPWDSIVINLNRIRQIRDQETISYRDFLDALQNFLYIQPLGYRNNAHEQSSFLEFFLGTASIFKDNPPKTHPHFPDILPLPTHQKISSEEINKSFGSGLYLINIPSHFEKHTEDGMELNTPLNFLKKQINDMFYRNNKLILMSKKNQSQLYKLHNRYLETLKQLSTRQKHIYQASYYYLMQELPEALIFDGKSFKLNVEPAFPRSSIIKKIADFIYFSTRNGRENDWFTPPNNLYTEEEIIETVTKMFDELEL